MRSTSIAVVVLLSILTASSNHPPLNPLPKNLREIWVADLKLGLKNARRPAAFSAAMKRPRQFSQTYRMNPMAARTFEVAGYSLFLQQRHSEATAEYVHAKALGEAIQELRTVAGAANALSNIHLIAGNIPGALEAARQAVSVELPESAPAFVASLKNHYARMLARSGRFEEATRVFTEVIEFSESEGLTGPRADAWKLIGRELMFRGEIDAAERAVREALRLRLLFRDPEIASDYYDLAEIRTLAGQPAEALPLLDLAERHISSGTRFQGWRIDLARGKARLAIGSPRSALDSLRLAIRSLDASPLYQLPGDLLRSHGAGPDEAHELFTEAALLEFERTGDRDLLRQAFTLSEAARAAALRAVNSNLPIPFEMSERYWNLVADLEEANAGLLSKKDERARQRVTRIHNSLAELEAEFDQATQILSRLKAPLPLELLGAGEALIAFQLGERRSVVWTIAQGQLEVTQIARRAVIQAKLKEWLAAPSGREKHRLAHEMYLMLMGELPRSVQAATHWLLAADGELFRAPLASLAVSSDSLQPVYLIERRNLQLIPGAWALERRRPAIRTGRFLAIGDPIYNDADPRRPRRWPNEFWRTHPAGLSRLPGSGPEVAACASFWPSSETLTGSRATPHQLARALRDPPAAIHLAIHVVAAPDAPNENLIALGAGENGEPSYVGPEWIGAQRLTGSLVMMNGCRSGGGTILAGEGLMGLTRAWLRAGASRVVSTYWPTVDDAGALAQVFYRQLTTGGRTTAEALRLAQMSMIAQSDWRADPDYWAAYFLIGYPE